MPLDDPVVELLDTDDDDDVADGEPEPPDVRTDPVPEDDPAVDHVHPTEGD